MTTLQDCQAAVSDQPSKMPPIVPTANSISCAIYGSAEYFDHTGSFWGGQSRLLRRATSLSALVTSLHYPSIRAQSAELSMPIRQVARGEPLTAGGTTAVYHIWRRTSKAWPFRSCHLQVQRRRPSLYPGQHTPHGRDCRPCRRRRCGHW